MTPVVPVAAVAAILFDDDNRVLLIQRGGEPGLGLWTVPGGRIEPGESAAAACVREAREETGLEIEVVELVEVVERISQNADGTLAYHYVILDYLVRHTGGQVRAGSDAAKLGYFALPELAGLATTHGLAPVVERALAMKAALATSRLPG